MTRLCFDATCAAGLALALAACPSEPAQDDAGRVVDAGAAVDAAAKDVSAGDALHADTAGRDFSSGDVGGGVIPCTFTGGECPEGQTCGPVGPSDALICRRVGPQALDEACGDQGTDDCVAGAVCVDVTGEGDQRCRPMCSLESQALPCSREGQACVPVFPGVGVGVCAGDACTPPDVDCAEGQRCAVVKDRVLACLPAGEVPAGGDCAGALCQAGTLCAQDGGGRVCATLCQEGADCSGATEGCFFYWDDIPGWGTCEAGECNLVTQAGCAEGEACYFDDTETGSSMCWYAGELGAGESCDAAELCAPGLDCFPTSDAPPYAFTCLAYCDDDHPCAAGSCQMTALIAGVRLCLE